MGLLIFFSSFRCIVLWGETTFFRYFLTIFAVFICFNCCWRFCVSLIFTLLFASFFLELLSFCLDCLYRKYFVWRASWNNRKWFINFCIALKWRTNRKKSKQRSSRRRNFFLTPIRSTNINLMSGEMEMSNYKALLPLIMAKRKT